MDPVKVVFLKSWSDCGGPDGLEWGKTEARQGPCFAVVQMLAIIEGWPELGLWDKKEQADARDIAKEK